ncbi:hypothetical protein Bca101_059254 [Brassica carinata]
MLAPVLLNPLHPRDPPDPPDPTVSSQSQPPSSSSLRNLHQTPPTSFGFRASCFFHDICYRGSRTETTQICLNGGDILFVAHVSSPSSTVMAPVCSGERNAPAVNDSSSFHGGSTFHSDTGHNIIRSSFIKDCIFKQLRLQPNHPKTLCLLSDAYTHTLN